MNLLDIYERKKEDLARIERQLEKSIFTEEPVLREASTHLLKAGGKRIRPIFVLLAGEFGDYQLDKLEKVAVSLELIHMATLVHDDVIDDTSTRRGQLTVKSKWDNRIAMYTGDYIFGKALSVISQANNPVMDQILSRAMVQICIGEMEQIRHFFNEAQTLRHYLKRIRRKTALLIAVSCQLGAIAADVPSPLVNRLYNYGYNVGMAFQIRDDILDICGTHEELGKPPGSDIKQGNITVPVLYAMEKPEWNKAVKHFIEKMKENPQPEDVREFLKMIRQSGGIERASQLAELYIEKALHNLKWLPDGETKKNLVDIAMFVNKRNY